MHLVGVSFLSALSQIVLFVDGMNGVISHNETVQWLYTLTGSLVSASAGGTRTTAVRSGRITLRFILVLRIKCQIIGQTSILR